MSALQFKHFYCPHCGKMFAKDHPAIAEAPMMRALRQVESGGGVLGVFSETVPCPNPKCGQPIDLRSVLQGRFDSPPFDPKGCFIWIVVIAAGLLLAWFVLTGLGRRTRPAERRPTCDWHPAREGDLRLASATVGSGMWRGPNG